MGAKESAGADELEAELFKELLLEELLFDDAEFRLAALLVLEARELVLDNCELVLDACELLLDV